jgi:hypothetical protein
MVLIKILISGGSISKEESGLSDREWNEFIDKFDLDDLRGERHKEGVASHMVTLDDNLTARLRRAAAQGVEPPQSQQPEDHG